MEVVLEAHELTCRTMLFGNPDSGTNSRIQSQPVATPAHHHRVTRSNRYLRIRLETLNSFPALVENREVQFMSAKEKPSTAYTPSKA